MKQVIINADDMGLSIGTNEAIDRAFKHGILRSASLMVNMPAYEDAIKNVIPDNPDLGIGIHLSLTEGKSVVDGSKIPLLVDEKGYFENSFIGIYNLINIKRCTGILSQIYKELDAQFEKLYSEGIKIDHANGHHHIHMIPPIFDIVVRLMKKYNCRMIRLTDERFIFSITRWYPGYYLFPWINGNIMKKVLLSRFAKSNKRILENTRTSDYFFGVLHSGCMDIQVLRYVFNYIKSGVTEIASHPGLYNSPEPGEYRHKKMEKRLQSAGCRVEFEALLADSLRYEIERNDIYLTRFSNVVKA